MFELEDFDITITGSLYEDIALHIDQHKTPLEEIENKLNERCKMEFIILCSNWWKQTFRVLNVNGFTNREVCNKIYTFYKHKTYRNLMGDHIWLEGWFVAEPDNPNIFRAVNYGS
jgi:hypothetical protein